jgi:cytochrome c peroxidase
MWDGRVRYLENQVRLPLEGRTEINIDWPDALDRLRTTQDSEIYLQKIGRNKLTESDITQSLAAFVSRLVAGDSPFDSFFFGRDETAITKEAKNGLDVFEGKGKCARCHLFSADFALFTDNSFHVLGAGSDTPNSDLGRYWATGDPQDIKAFKTPPLRNVSSRPQFMHDGSIKSLHDVIEFYDRGGNREIANIDSKLEPLNLAPQDKVNLEIFLQTLTSPVVFFTQ